MRTTVTTLSTWTGIHRDTIRKRLSSILTGERGEQVDSVDALRLIYGGGESLDPSQERARLDKIRREALEHEVALKRREVIRVEVVNRILDSAATGFREHLMGLAGRWSDEFAADADAFSIHAKLDAEIRQALTHLASAKNHPEFT